MDPESAAAADDEPHATIGARTLRGTLWTYSSYVGGRVIVLGSTAVLARLLSPREFGLVALVLVVTTVLDTLQQLGLGQALVTAPKEGIEAMSDAVFRLSVVLGLGLGVIGAALGPVAAAAFDQPALLSLLPLMAVNLLLQSLVTTHNALAARALDFRSRMIAEVLEVVVRGVVSIVLALSGVGAASILIGYLAGTLTRVVALWWLVPWRPRLQRRLERSTRDVMRSSGQFAALEAIGAVTGNIDNLVVGRVLGATALGLYSIGFRLPELLIYNFAVVVAEVLLPAFSAVDRRALGDAFVTSLRYIVMVGLPLTLSLIVLAEPFVLALFGPQWERAVEVMQVLSAYMLVGVVGIPAGTAYKATNQLGVLFWLLVPRFAVLVPALVLFAEDGIVAVAWCMTVSTAVVGLINMVLAMRLLQQPASAVLGALGSGLVPALGATAVLVGVRAVVEQPWPTLIVAGVLGGATYVALLWVFARSWLLDVDAKLGLSSRIRTARGRERPSPSR